MNSEFEYRSIEEHIHELIAEQYGVSRHRIENGVKLMDLGDSLDLVESIMAIEEELKVDLHDSLENPAVTVQDFVDIVTQLKGNRYVVPIAKKTKQLDYRKAILGRIEALTNGRLNGSRFGCVGVELYKILGGDPATKRGKKEAAAMTTVRLPEVNDEELLKLFELTVRMWTKQM